MWGHISRGSATPLPEGGGAPALPNFGGTLLFMHTPFDAELPNFDVVTPVARGLVFRNQSCPHPTGTASLRSPILGIYAYTFCRRTTEFDTVTRDMWGGATPLIPRERSYGFPIIGILLYLSLHPLTQNDQNRHSNW